MRAIPSIPWGVCLCVAIGASGAHPGLHDEIGALDARLARAPLDGELYLERAQRERLGGEWEQALADLDRAALLRPDDARVDAERGLTFSALGCDVEATAQLTRSLGRGTATARTFAEWARVEARAGRRDEALVGFDAAIALAPDPDLYLERGAVLEDMGRLDEAAAGYAQGFARLSGAAALRLAFARVEAAQGRPRAALALAHGARNQRAPMPAGEAVTPAARGTSLAPLVTVVRQPYLQLGTETSMTVVWRTDVATDSRVHFGTTPEVLDLSVDSAESTTDHVVTLTGLDPSTRYFYDVGSTAALHAGGTTEHYFDTAPVTGTPAPFRAWLVGDSGLGNLAQAEVRDAMLAATASHPPDLFLHMGDIAYSAGTDSQFTDFHFTPYRDILRHTVLWTTLGNHEGASTVSGAPGPSVGPYYTAFVLPTGGEAGGEPSGTEAYYSFDYANVHFVSLNSYQVARSATGAMAIWLEADLAANVQPWVIAFWHHPPYTHGTHNSDAEIEHIEMRENFLPILEAAGVDLVLGGHSHSYERSRLIDGTYATPTPGLATLVAEGHVLDMGDGVPAGDGAYYKAPGSHPHDGTVYVVAGHGGADVGGAVDHPVMYFSEAAHGSVLLDVDGETLTLTNLRSTGVVSDTFTIRKSPPAPCEGDAECASLSRGCTVGICSSGFCTTGPAGDGTPCDDGNVCTFLDACFGGSCAGAVPVPADVTNLRWESDKLTLAWDPTAGAPGDYDLARGGPSDLPLTGGEATCLESGLAFTSTSDAEIPADDAWFWYLVRGGTACHPGTWGHAGEQGAQGEERSLSACP